MVLWSCAICCYDVDALQNVLYYLKELPRVAGDLQHYGHYITISKWLLKLLQLHHQTPLWVFYLYILQMCCIKRFLQTQYLL